MGLEVREILQQGAKRMGIPLSKEKGDLLMEYLEMISFWNKRINLTAIREDRRMVTHHLLDSLSCFSLLGDGKMLDAGTGAGLPAIPLLIIKPSLEMTLLDSSKKKCIFLKQVRRELKLDFRVLEGRMENIAHQRGERGFYHVVLSRAMAPLYMLLELSMPFLQVGGFLIAFKSRAKEEELKEAEGSMKVLEAQLLLIKEVVIPFLPEERFLLKIGKGGETKDIYPRKRMIMEKNPL